MIKRITFILIIFIIIFCFISNSYCYVFSDFMTKDFPNINDLLFEHYNYYYKVIVYDRSDNTYYLYNFSGNRYTGNNLSYYENSNSVVLYGFSFTYRLVDNGKQYYWQVISQNSALSDTLQLNNIVDYFSTKTGNGIEIIYSNVDILYNGTEKIYYYKPPWLKSIVFQRSIGGCMYQIFMTLLIPLLLFLVMLFGFYKCFEFIQDILIQF